MGYEWKGCDRVIKANITSKSGVLSQVCISELDFEALKLLAGTAFVNYSKIEMVEGSVYAMSVSNEGYEKEQKVSYGAIEFPTVRDMKDWINKTGPIPIPDDFKIEHVIPHGYGKTTVIISVMK